MKISFSTTYCILLVILLLGLSSLAVQAQILVDKSMTDEELVQSLAGKGVIISDIQVNCPVKYDTIYSYGRFECKDCNVGIPSGLLLTTGSIQNAIGPNDKEGAGQDNKSDVSDPDLNAISGVLNTRDVCSISFDVEASADTLRFNYVFASEEYLEYVNENYNDVFAFFIEGPDLPMQNIALLPNTNIPVSIDNVNNESNAEYYINNGTGNNSPQKDDEYYIQYDGFTKVLTAEAPVIPCEKYRLKLVIADDTDFVLDSGVFIEAGSLTTNEISLQTRTSLQEQGFVEFQNAIEGCVDAFVVFRPNRTLQEPVTVSFELSGTAIEGVDYASVDKTIVLNPGDEEVTIPISPIKDNEIEGEEIVKIKLTDTGSCNEAFLDSIEIIIQDNIEGDASVRVAGELRDTIYTCPGTNVRLMGSGGINCSWEPTTYINDPSDCNPTAKPESDIVYTLTTWIDDCVDTSSVYVFVSNDFDPDVKTEVEFCEGQTGSLYASGGDFYVWTPVTNLSCGDCPEPVFTGTEPATYQLTVYGNGGCVNKQFEVNVTFGTGGLGFTDETLDWCAGIPYELDLSNVDTYTISPMTDVSCSDCPNPTLEPTSNTTYSIDVSAGLCEQSFELTFNITDFQIDAGEDVGACQMVTATLGSPAIAGYTYSWSPSEGLDRTDIAQPQVTINATQGAIIRDYTLEVSDATGNCTGTDVVKVSVDLAPTISIIGPDTVSAGNQVTLSVSGFNGAGVYTWASSTDGVLQDSKDLTIAPSTTTLYTMILHTDYGCTVELTKEVVVIQEPSILIASAFSPNGDNLNDELKLLPLGVEEVLDFQIFNRWGNEVFRSSGLEASWDGTTEGDIQPMGVYVYQVRYRVFGETEEKLEKGQITLIR